MWVVLRRLYQIFLAIDWLCKLISLVSCIHILRTNWLIRASYRLCFYIVNNCNFLRLWDDCIRNANIWATLLIKIRKGVLRMLSWNMNHNLVMLLMVILASFLQLFDHLFRLPSSIPIIFIFLQTKFKANNNSSYHH